MPIEQINEVKLKDTQDTKEPKISLANVEIIKSKELKELANGIDKIKDEIDHDQPVTTEQIEQIKKTISQLTVNIGGEEFPLDEIKNIPDLKANAKIWQEIKNGNLENTNKLTFLSVETAEHLAEHKGILDLSGLISITDQTAKHLAEHEGYLGLNGLKSITDQAAEHLAGHEGDLWLSGLTSITDQTAEHLSKHEGYLGLDGLTSITDQTAEHLAKHEGGLGLNGLKSITDQAAEHLAEHEGYLSLNSLTSITDQTAEHLAKHKGALYLSDDIRK
jgi:hypothetical protein